jgi:RimJ/RimL family protein N-acetyltransferase
MRTAICPTNSDFHELAYHFLTLSAGDQLLRFGELRSDLELVEYADTLLRRSEVVFVVMEPAPSIAGVVHLQFAQSGVNLGLSVSDWARGQGIGTLLLERTVLFASSFGIGTLYARELSENSGLRNLATRAGMNVAWVLPDGSTRLDFPAGRRNPIPSHCDAGSMILADHCLRFQAQVRNPALSPSLDPLESTVP